MIEEVKDNFEKLSKNKFFVVGLIGVIGMAIFVILKKNNSSSELSVVTTESYPSVEENATNVIDSVNQEATINTNAILENLQDLETSMYINSMDMGQDLKDTILQQSSSTNDYLKEGFQSLNDKVQFTQENILDKMQNTTDILDDKIQNSSNQLLDRLEIKTNTIANRIDTQIELNDQNFSNLNRHLDNTEQTIVGIVSSNLDTTNSVIKNSNNQMKNYYENIMRNI